LPRLRCRAYQAAIDLCETYGRKASATADIDQGGSLDAQAVAPNETGSSTSAVQPNSAAQPHDATHLAGNDDREVDDEYQDEDEGEDSANHVKIDKAKVSKSHRIFISA